MNSPSAPSSPFADLLARPRADAATWLGIYLVLLFAIPSRLVVAPLGSAGAVSMIAGLGSMVVWVLLWLASVDTPLPRPQPLHVALGGFLVAVGISYALAMTHPISPDEISPADVALISVASWSGTLLIAHDWIRSRARLDALVWWTAVSGGLMALLGIVQFISRQLIVDLITIPGLTEISQPENIERNGLVRPAGTAIHPIEYGTLLSMLLPLALHVGFHHRHRGWVVRWLPTVAIGLIIGLSSSRSAYVSAAVALVVCLFGWTRRQRVVVLGSLAAGLAVLAIALPRLIRAVTSLFVGADSDPSIESRTDSYSFAWSFIVQHPLFGRGLGTLLPKYRIFDNQYLLLLVTVGVIGTIAFCALAVTAAVMLYRSHRRLPDEPSTDLAISLTAAIISGFTSLAFFDAFAFPMTMGALFLMLGMAGAFNRLSYSP
jgi:O-antigen ligase